MSVLFISHSSRDAELAALIKQWCALRGFEQTFLDFDKHTGIAAGEDWEQRLYREIDRCHAFIIILTPNWHDSKWCFSELTYARGLGKRIFPLVFSKSGSMQVLPNLQAVDLTSDIDTGMAELGRRLDDISLNAQRQFGWDKRRSPYPGLMAFEEADAAIYFGRDDEIDRVIERLNAIRNRGAPRLAALLGASGAGKSSLIRAGVLPRLKKLHANWIVLPPFRPKRDGLEELAQALASHLRKDAGWMDGLIRAWQAGDHAALSKEIVRELRAQSGSNEADILITVDQAEELFTLHAPGEAQRFFTVMSALLGNDLPFYAIASMRTDFLSNLLVAAGLAVPFEQIALKPMPRERISQIIEGPASVVGLHIEAGLAQLIARDAGTEDALPLLAFALREMYQGRHSPGALTIADYEKLGDKTSELTPIENAVRRRADAVLEAHKPSAEEELALRDAFIPGLVGINDANQYVRQRARWSDLPPRALPMIEALVQARLLIVSENEKDERGGGGGRMVEVAHEALIRKWPLLTRWLGDEIEFLRGKKQLGLAVHDWLHAGERRGDVLWSGLNLDRAADWMERHPHGLSADERAFIEASLEARGHALVAEEARRRAMEESQLAVERAAREKAETEAEAARRLAGASRRVARRTRIGLAATSAMLVVAAVAGGWAFVERGRVVAERDKTEAERVKAEEARAKAEEARALADLLHLRAVRNSVVSKNTGSRVQATLAESKRIDNEFKGYVDTTLSFINGLASTKQGGAFQDLMTWAESERNAAGRSHGRAGTNAVTNQFEILIRRTESMDDEERKDWFSKLPIMTIGQRARLMQILFVEREKLAALEAKYQGEIKQLNRQHLSEWASKKLSSQATGWLKSAEANAKLWESGTKVAAIQAHVGLVRNTPATKDDALVLIEIAEELKAWLRDANIGCGGEGLSKEVSSAVCTLDDRRLEIAEKFEIKEKQWRLLVLRAQRREASGLVPQAAADLSKALTLTEEIAAAVRSADNYENVGLIAGELLLIVELLENRPERVSFPSYQELVLKRFNALVSAKEVWLVSADKAKAKPDAAKDRSKPKAKEDAGPSAEDVLQTLNSLSGEKKGDGDKAAEVLNTIVWQAATDPVFRHFAPRDRIAQLAEDLRKSTTDELGRLDTVAVYYCVIGRGKDAVAIYDDIMKRKKKLSASVMKAHEKFRWADAQAAIKACAENKLDPQLHNWLQYNYPAD